MTYEICIADCLNPFKQVSRGIKELYRQCEEMYKIVFHNSESIKYFYKRQLKNRSANK
jgi:hypothetical protein